MAFESTTRSIYMVTLAILAVASCIEGQGTSGSSIPGAQTAAGIMASSLDGMSRYFAPDGPIQPAITAIGGLPMRGGEMINKGITSISSGLNSGAQSMSRSAGNDGTIRMPGMQSLRSMMPEQVNSLGSMMRSAIQGKNGFIRGQAESGVEAGNRLRSMMERGLQSRRKRDTMGEAAGDLATDATMMHGGMQMMEHMQDTMMKGGQQIKSQLKEHLDGAMNRMQGMQGMGDNMRNQVQGIGRTLSSGLQGTMEQLQKTHEQVHKQLEGGLKQNMGAMSGMMSSMQGSMGKMSQHMQNNGQGLVKAAQSAMQQMQSSIHQAVQGPLSMVQNLGSGLTNMMQGKMSVMSSGGHGGQKGGSGGRY